MMMKSVYKNNKKKIWKNTYKSFLSKILENKFY